MKICTKCNVAQPVENFRKYPDYRSGACKDCERKYHTQYLRKTRKDDVPLYKREVLLAEGLGYCGQCKGTFPLSDFRKSNRTLIGYEGTCRTCKGFLQRASRVKRYYKLEYKEYLSMLENQQDKCAICLTTFEAKSICVDHNHNTGDVRGLLCHTCNRALGLFKDSKKILSRTLQYLDGSHKIPLNGEHPEEGNPVLNPLVIKENA